MVTNETAELSKVGWLAKPRGPTLQHLHNDNLFVTPALIIIHNAGRFRAPAPTRRDEAVHVYRLILYL